MNLILSFIQQKIKFVGKTQKAVLLLLAIAHNQIESNVKVFINNSSKIFSVRIYDSKNNILSLKLNPGDVHDAFIQGDVLDKIVVQDERISSRSISSMTRQSLRKESSKINENMIFIINQDGSVKMYKGTTSRDEVLRKVDEAYIQQAKLPTIDLSIHTIKSNQPWTTQNINYTIKLNKSFLASIESLFS